MNRKFYPVVLEKEFQFLKLVKEEPGELNFLFLSTWDPICKDIIGLVSDINAAGWYEDAQKPLYVIDSWNIPTVFPTMQVDKVPALVTIPKNRRSGFFRKEEHVSYIYKALELE